MIICQLYAIQNNERPFLYLEFKFFQITNLL